jgi:acyl-CoA synthetase (AMP-forming)/AMP-acid ligase II
MTHGATGVMANKRSLCAEIPLSLALPAAATTLAYLNARWSLSYDLNLLKGLLKMSAKSRIAERGDRLNLFYTLEAYALDPKTADNDFIVYNGRTTTFHETYITALCYGAWFKTVHGIKRKEIVAIDFMNSSTFIFMLLGLWSIGAVPAFINYNLSGKPLTHSIRTSSARLVVVDEEVRHCFPEEQEKILTSPNFRDGKGPVEIVFHTPEVEAQILGMEPMREDDKARSGLIPRDMAILIYTSGTTGLPKPAIVSWKKCWSGSLFVKDWLNITPSDRFFTVRSTKFTNVAVQANLLTSACLFTIVPLRYLGL